MTGGIIISIHYHTHHVCVAVKDKLGECAVQLKPTNYEMLSGDRLWWANGTAYWTPATERYRRMLRKDQLRDVALAMNGWTGSHKSSEEDDSCGE